MERISTESRPELDRDSGIRHDKHIYDQLALKRSQQAISLVHGHKLNTNFDILDQAVNGILALTLSSAGSSGSPTDIPVTDGAVSNGRNKFIEFTDGGDLGGTAYVRLTPNDAEKIVFVRNSLSAVDLSFCFKAHITSNDFELPTARMQY